MSRISKASITLASLESPPQIPPNKYFLLQPVVSKGLGLIAKCDIQAGTRVLIEDAMVSYDANAYDGHGAVWRAFSFRPGEEELYDGPPVARFTDAQKEVYLKLAKGSSLAAWFMEAGLSDESATCLSNLELPRGYFLCILRGIAKVNEFDKGVYEVASRFNHSCSPNCDTVYYERTSDVLSVYATKDVKKGDELTINYYPQLIEPHDLAVEDLLHLKGFLCVCSFCTLPSSERCQLIANRERIRRLSEDFSFLMYRIEPKRMIDQFHPEDLFWGRVPHKRALGPLPSSVIDKKGNIQLDAACAELDHLLEEADMHGKEVIQLYMMMGRIVATFADTRSFAKSGKAWLYASKWLRRYIEEAELMGGFDAYPNTRENNDKLTRYVAEKCRQLRQIAANSSDAEMTL